MNNATNEINNENCLGEDMLQIEALEERSSFEVHGACACTCSCNCSSCSCIVYW
jgi:hypothetical protein